MNARVPADTVLERTSWDRVRYANVWEDADVLCEALAPVASGARLLSIASAGDNALALLTLDPSEVVAADLSSAQLACLALRRVAFQHLDHEPLLAFLGVTAAPDRLRTYRALSRDLPADARAFWDARPQEIARGVVHAGRFEQYFTLFRRWVLPCVHGAATRHALLEPRSLDAQREFYDTRWDTPRWRILFKLFFSRAVMGHAGRDPALFSHVEGAVGSRILERTRHALTRIPVASNPYLAFIMTGQFPAGARPRYLRAEHFALIRERLSRLTLVQGPIQVAARGPFMGFNLSDLFEYLDPVEHETCYSRLLDAAAPGARLVYWNLLVPRQAPPSSEARIRPLAELAEDLHARDQAWFYSRLRIDEVLA